MIKSVESLQNRDTIVFVNLSQSSAFFLGVHPTCTHRYIGPRGLSNEQITASHQLSSHVDMFWPDPPGMLVRY